MGSKVVPVKARVALAVAAPTREEPEEEIHAARSLVETIGYGGGIVFALVARAFQCLLASDEAMAIASQREIDERTARLGRNRFWLAVIDPWRGRTGRREPTGSESPSGTPAVGGGAGTTPPLMRRIAVVGLGAIARSHLDALQRRGGLSVEAGVDPAPGRSFEFDGQARPVYSSISVLLERHEVDDVIVTTPTPTHAEVCEEIPEAEVRPRILVEKPLATTPGK